MSEYRKAFQILLKDPYTSLQTRETYKTRCVWGIFGDYEEETWRLSGGSINTLLDFLGLTVKLSPERAEKLCSLDIIKVPSTYEGLHGEVNNVISVLPEEIWVHVLGPNWVDIKLVYEQEEEDRWEQEYTYCGGFAVEWYQEIKDEQSSEDVPKGVQEKADGLDEEYEEELLAND